MMSSVPHFHILGKLLHVYATSAHFCILLHTSAYFCILPHTSMHDERQGILRACFKVWSMHLASTLYS